jgi:hypothetical protein
MQIKGDVGMGVVRRPPVVLSPGRGLFRNEICQVAYVTNDLARARAIFSQRYGIGDYLTFGGDTPHGGHLELALAWAGGTMYELVHAMGPGTEFYTDRLPADGAFAIRHHHLGYFVETRAGWDALMAEIEQGGLPVAFRNDMPGFLNACYVEAPELGHYLEYMFCEPEGVKLFESVPSS